jgi:hypothetical protein
LAHSAPLRVPALKVLLGVSLIGGLVFGVIQETQGQALLFWSFVVLSMCLAAAAAAFGPGKDATFRAALKTVPLLVVAVLALSFGDFGAYALEIDGRSLDGYNEGVSMSWPSKLAATLLIGAVYGALLGLVAAMAAWMLRRALVRARPPQ